ncbi:hypothetical protein B0T11DRAFT_329727 [Plectosphaerella cucumerina]|uniref:Uncharacterized protein n=1 Tax=Plectosphaerella cucumerina TaxID=40658 RepID=A0A8K0X147_9PEZI|nr:hypothetical protein B0T11DRAFT_329727 [Plectosphaerella cucumerina]
MPTPAGILKSSPGGGQSRKRPLSPEPWVANPRYTTAPPQKGQPNRRALIGPAVPSSPELDSHPGINGHAEKLPNGTKARLTNGQLRLKLAREFNREKFDRDFYGQEGASAPPPGVAPSQRKPAPDPGNDGKLYLRLDPRIHWPRDWSDEWYEEKMKEIKARGTRKANWGKAAKRMREQRLMEEALAAEEQEALAAGEPLRRRREPRPWAHRRHIDFSDVPEERLPGLVKADPAWLRACAWMRTNRTKGLQTDEEAKQIKAKGRSVQHLVGRTGW